MPSNSVVYKLVTAPNNYMYAATDFGIYRSTDLGSGWGNVGTGLLGSSRIRSLMVDPEGNVFAGIGEGVFMSTDDGTSWTEINEGLVPPNTRSFTSNSNGFIFAGTGGHGVSRSVHSMLPLPGEPSLLSPENGNIISSDSVLCAWTACGPSVTNYRLERAADSLFTTDLVVDSLITDTLGIFHGLTSDSVYWWRVSAKNGAGWGEYSTPRWFKVILTGIDYTHPKHNEFRIRQNYPNPFNPVTTIKYSIPSASKIVVKIFNILGKEVEVLADGFKPAGTYTINWDASDFPSGVYIYQISAGKFVQSRKMVLLR